MMKDAPQWVQEPPRHPAYYHGVGMATKTTHQDYRERARQNALSDLAAGISVNISSQSVLNQFEFDNVHSEFFRDNIRVSTQQFLEGYEIAGSWENDLQYWVYYRLSRSVFEQIKQERVNRALSQALSRLQQAEEFAERGRKADALGFSVKALEDIQEFMGEELLVERGGTKRPFAALFASDLTDKLRDIEIEFSEDVVRVKPGRGHVRSVDVTIRDSNGRTLSGMPVTVRYSWMPGQIIEANTDASGRFTLHLQGIKPGRRTEQVSCRVNFQNIVRNNTSELTVQRLLGAYSTSEFIMPVEIVSPVFTVEIESQSLGSGNYTAKVRDEFTRLLNTSGIETRRYIRGLQTDYRMNVLLEKTGVSQSGSRFTVDIKKDIVVTDSDGKTVYRHVGSQTTGLGASENAALEDALNSMEAQIRITLFPEMMNEIF